MRARHVLIVAWWFPPLAGGGVHRPLQFVRNLVRRGVRVTVLTGVPPRGERTDAGLLAQVPSEARVLRVARLDPFRIWAQLRPRRNGTPAADAPAEDSPARPGGGRPRLRWQDAVTEAIALPDRFRAWIVPATARAALALHGDEPDLVFSTAPPHSLHLIGRHLAGLFACPLVLDFRDPWLGNPFRRYPAPLFERIDAELERGAVAAAAEVVLNTPALERRFRERHPGFARVRTIPNGFDPESFAGLPAPRGSGREGVFEIAHFGQLYGERSGRPLLEALARLDRIDPDGAARVRLVFVGSIDGEAGFRERARELGVADRVEIPGALSHREALLKQRATDALLLLGPESREPEVQVPGKLYEYLAAQRPILCLSREGGAISETLARAGAACERAEPDDPDAIAATLPRLMRRGGEEARSAGLDAFRYDRLTDRLLDCFEDALAGATASRAGLAARARPAPVA